MNAIFATGSNGSAQLGIRHSQDVSVPKPVVFHPGSPTPTPTVVRIAAGGNHTLLLSESGQLFWSGDGTTGACGLPLDRIMPVFQEARLVREDDAEEIGHIALIAATWEASIIVAEDEDGKRTKMFSFGVGNKGELGLGELIIRTPSAARIKEFPPPGTEIVDLSACMGHVVAVLDNGDAYGWGNCRKSQIGEPDVIVYAPRKIQGIDFKVTRAVCANEATCFFGGPDTGNIRVLGSDKWTLTSKAPSTISPWIDVGASWGNFYVLHQDGSLESWGRDDHGQLPPPNLPKLEKIAIGSEHVVALSEEGEVLAWGWGEHGNCGPEVENNDVKGRWNVIASSKFIPSGCNIERIGAGCATSWIFIRAN
ncbi:RCC1 repeat-containing protein C10F6.04 [Cladobotryum mycophilum]|uniref:RCC1 repeat-containing protein C10F6.04 n=1 Tax=Cladobotryum mycophilum TaxID=491253 RepID=A0ABR0SQX6_9HYPO